MQPGWRKILAAGLLLYQLKENDKETLVPSPPKAEN
jgi:predicted RNA-binding Zn-ribbon protein involved in translation (DUF1610 family)